MIQSCVYVCMYNGPWSGEGGPDLDLQDFSKHSCVCGYPQQRRKDAAAKAEDLAEQQRLRLLEKERATEANRLLVRLTLSADRRLRHYCICIWASWSLPNPAYPQRCVGPTLCP